MPTPKIVFDLVERFREHEDEYRNPSFNETQTRIQFLDPLFEALGWDMQNKQGYAEAYKEVVHEDALKTAGGHKAPDYGFRIGGVRKFFLEAKKPAIAISADPDPAYQVRRYAWSAKLSLSILSNFAEFAVYDCRIRPIQGDKPGKARTLYFTYEDLPERWDELAAIFSKDAILKGSFDKYAVGGKGKRGTSEVDDEFLREIESWRDALARNIALRNSDLTFRDLNYAVQQTIDRIIFLRISEDRGIESYGRLMALLNGENVYDRLKQIFRDADDRYNSGLFHFKVEKNRLHPPDQLTLSLAIDDKPLKDIIRSVYYPESPYEFSVLPADILGQVYEQFLGKVIRLTAGGHAKVEEKPEVKKAGGVYYTPTYIVDHIVRSAVGKLLEGRTPNQIAGATKGGHPLRVLDPACGSGSFLLGAFQYLLDWYRAAYVKNDPAALATGKNPKLFRARVDDWCLTIAERKRILLDHIYGVDIDPQAVEVTKLSLLLKVLEGESNETLHKTYEMFHQRALPDLDDNIKCGNSLIGPEFYSGRLDLDEDERLRINAFDWKSEFAGVFKTAGGFDAVIGNPPYISALALSKLQGESVKDYWKECYRTARGTYDIYVLFLEKALYLTRPKGFVAFITPNKFLSAPYGQALRELLLKDHSLERLVDYSSVSVFEDASVYPVISVIRPRQPFPGQVEVLRAVGAGTVASEGLLVSTGDLKKFPENIWGTLLGSHTQLCARVYGISRTLESVARVQATSTAAEADEYSAYMREKSSGVVGSKLVNTGTIDKYLPLWGLAVLTNKGAKYKRPVLDLSKVKPERAEIYATPKIVFAKMAKTIECFFDSRGEFASLNTNCVYSPRDGLTLGFLVAVLNARLLTFIYRNVFAALRMSGGYSQFQAPQLRLLPIATPSVVLRESLERLATQMAARCKELTTTRTPHEQEGLKRTIAVSDRQIDKLVYELYGLTDQEIALVEEDMQITQHDAPDMGAS